MPKRREVNGLNVKQRKFVKAYVTSSTQTEAALAAGYSPLRAGITGSELANRPDIQEAIRKEMERQGLDLPSIVAKVKEGTEARETKFFQHEGAVVDQRDVVAWGARHAHLETACKLAGYLNPRFDGGPGSGGNPLNIAVIVMQEREKRGLLLKRGA